MPTESEFQQLRAATDELAIAGRTPNSALLLWFLIHVKRLEADEAEDAISDGPGDKGIDGLWIDPVAEEINILQGKQRKALSSTQGDADIAKLMGAAAWFVSPERVDDLLAAGPNEELQGLLVRHDIRRLVADGYGVRCVFVTNSAFDVAGSGYLTANAAGPPPLEGWDLDRLTTYVRYADRPIFIEEESTLRFAEASYFRVSLQDGVEVVYGALSGDQIASLPGIEDRTLFAQNVRLNLGRTRVNKDINVTLKDPSEHSKFLTFHNGLTIVATELRFDKKEAGVVRIRGFSMVNGCQSAVAVHDNKAAITKELLLPVRLVRIGDSARLADDITYRSNNQNPINLKDLRANDVTQVTLKGQFRDLFGPEIDYVIKRGEETGAKVMIPNDLAAQILIALYNREPWMSHRKFDLFDQRYKDVFHPRIEAPHVYLGYLIYQEVLKRLGDVANRLMAGYGLTTFALIYLVGLLLRESPVGQGLLENPLSYLKDNEVGVRQKLELLIRDMLVDFNFYVDEKTKESGYFDYKTLFKNQRAVTDLAGDIVRSYKKEVIRSPNREFRIKDEGS